MLLSDSVTLSVPGGRVGADDECNRNVGLALTVLQRRRAPSLAAIRSSLERRLKRLNDLKKLGSLRKQIDAGELPEDFKDMDGVPVAGIIIAAEITPKLEAAAKTNANVRLVEYAVRIELLPREQEHCDRL